MPIPVADIDARLSAILNDEERIRWPLPERIAWINDAASEIVIIRPPAHSVTEVVELEEGALQYAPEQALLLLDVVRNIKANDKPGKAVTRTDRMLLDEQVPGWYEAKLSSTILHYTFDDRLPREFYVYPPAAAGTKVEVRYSAPPAPVADIDDELDLHRAYIGPVVSYVLYRALAKDSEYANGAVAAAHLQAFNQALGARNEISVAVGPKGAISEAP